MTQPVPSSAQPPAALEELSLRLRELLELPEDERRERLLGLAASGDAEDRRVVTLLERARNETFLAQPASVLMPELVSEAMLDLPCSDSGVPRESSLVGCTIDSWRLDELLASGGMGEVYLGSRADGQYEQKVAVKVVSQSLAASSRRFLSERQLLAELEHPNIARLIDGGMMDDGTPYLVTELVVGRSIDRYVDDNRLDVDATLDLFLEVCAAVEYAHSRWIVHRDLKPANILVSEAESRPRVKLLDFGVASLLESDAGGMTESRAPMTRSFAAPEQQQHRRVDQRADVYSLGVVLYRLLSGRRPEETLGAGYLPASETLDRAGDGLSPGRRRLLRGDLDAILERALETDPVARYASVSEFADDLRRHLHGLPVSVRQAEVAYRVRSWLRRRWPLVLTIGLLSAILMVGVGFLVDRARSEARARLRSDRIVEFLREALAPEHLASSEARTTALLQPAVAEAMLRFREDPDLEAAVLETLGVMLADQQEHASAKQALERSVELTRQRLPERYEMLVRNLIRLGWSIGSDGDPEAGLARLDEALVLARSYGGDSALITASTLRELGLFEIRLISYGEARRDLGERHLRESLELHRDLLGEAAPETARVHLQWGLSLSDSAQRLAELEAALELLRDIYPAGSLELAQALADVALVYEGAGRTKDAIRLGWQAKGLYDRLAPRGSSLRLDIVNNLAGMLRDSGEFSEAEPLYQEVLDLRRRLNSGDAVALAYPLYGLGRVQAAQGHCRIALPHFDEARRLLDSSNKTVASALVQFALAECMVESVGFVAAKPTLEASLAALEQNLPSDHHDLRSARQRFEVLERVAANRIP